MRAHCMAVCLSLIRSRAGGAHLSPVLQLAYMSSFTRTIDQQRTAFAQFCRQAEQLVQALEARGGPFAQSSCAEISVSQLEDPLTTKAFRDLTDLPFILRVAGEAPLSLAEARTLYKSCLIDALCSVLRRLQWRCFCSRLDDLAALDRGFTTAGSALICIRELLESWHRIEPCSDEGTARPEIFGRCGCLGKGEKRFTV